MADYFIAVGTFLLALVGVAMLVAGFELLRQREMLERVQRDRAAFAASRPLPLVAASSRADTRPHHAAPPSAAATLVSPPAAAAATRKDPGWIETRPMVLGFDGSADSGAERQRGEVDLLLG